MNLSIVMMKQRAICMVISALRDNWNLQRPIQCIIGGGARSSESTEKVIMLSQNSLELLFKSWFYKFILVLH